MSLSPIGGMAEMHVFGVISCMTPDGTERERTHIPL